jgi:molybdate transport system substrate-binding protein
MPRMHSGTRFVAAVVLALVAGFATPSTSYAQLKVIASGGFRSAYNAALPDFERASGVTVTTGSGASQGDGPNTIGAQLRRGVPFDLVIMAKEGLEDLAKEGRLVSGTAVDLASTPVGVAVRAGAPKPDLSTVDAFKRTLLNATRIGYVNSTVGIYLTTKLFRQLGIADQIASKLDTRGVAAVASGDVEISIQPLSELTHVAGTEVAGLLPNEIQYISVFSAAVVDGAQQPDAARQFIAYLSSARADAAMTTAGMKPLRAK